MKKIIKTSIILFVIVIGLLMLGGYHMRGYFAIGAEIFILPLWILATYEYAIHAAERY